MKKAKRSETGLVVEHMENICRALKIRVGDLFVSVDALHVLRAAGRLSREILFEV